MGMQIALLTVIKHSDLKMKNKITRMSAALLLFFGFATSSQAIPITINMTGDNLVSNGGLCFDMSCILSTDWATLNSGVPLANANNWQQSDSVTIDLGVGTHYFAWQIGNRGSADSGNPAALLAEILWDGNANYSSSGWEIYDQPSGN
ncbi:MAG: hypothetical protein DRR06_16960, partial [Gammaproteobacteria bacterium]